MYRRFAVSSIAFLLLVGSVGTCSDANAQGLFRRLQSRIRSRVQAIPPVQPGANLQRPQPTPGQTDQDQAGTATTDSNTANANRGQRIRPISPSSRQAPSSSGESRQPAAPSAQANGAQRNTTVRRPQLSAPTRSNDPTAAKPLTPRSTDTASQPESRSDQTFGSSILARPGAAADRSQRQPESVAPPRNSNPTAANATRESASKAQQNATQQRKGASLGIQVVETNDVLPGLTVAGLNGDSPAARAGLRRGDVIFAVDGIPTPTIKAIASHLKTLNSDAVVSLRVVRQEQSLGLTVPLAGGATYPVQNLPSLVTEDSPPALAPAPAKTNVSLAQALGISFHDVPDVRGPVVQTVSPRSPASAAGLQVGDRIVSLNGRLLVDSAALERALETADVGNPLPLQVVRNGALVGIDVQPGSTGDLAVDDDTRSAPGGQSDQAGSSVLEGLGSVFGGLLGGSKPSVNKASVSKPSVKTETDEMALGDDEPVQQAGFESNAPTSAIDRLRKDPPSLEAIDLPPSDLTPLGIHPPENQRPVTAPTAKTQKNELRSELLEQIRRLEEELRALDAKE